MSAIRDLGLEVGQVHAKVDNVDERLQFTNGKVAMLVEDKIRRDERKKVVKEFKDQVPKPVVGNAETVLIQQKWFQNDKLAAAVAALLLAVSAAIGYLVRGS